MKIHLYNYSLPIVFSFCDKVLEKMDYQVNYADFKRGMISASKGQGLSSLSSLIDLKFSCDKFSVGIAIISSSMSNIFGNMYNDPVSEQEFIENLFRQLEAKEIINPLRAPGERLIEALAS